MSNIFVEQDVQKEKVKNAKILNRKQIQKRLSGLKIEQYQKISVNLQLQNEKLKNEVKILNQKVQELVKSRKINKTKNPQIEQELGRLRRQLQLKYESMNHLKDAIAKTKQGDSTEQIQMKIREHSNIIQKNQKQYKQLQLKKQNLITQIDRNQQDVKQYLPPNESDEKIEKTKIQNKELKAKISKLKEQLNLQQKNSINAMNKLYELKGSQKPSLSKSSKSISASLKQIKATSVSEINSLQEEILKLKARKNTVQKDLVSDKIIKQSKKAKLENEIKEALQNHKEMYKKRIKLVNQLNFYQNRDSQLKHQLEKDAMISSIVYLQKQVQTTKIIPQQFRREWIGKSQGLPFNDARILQYRGQSLIKGVTIFRTPQNIVFTRFHYESPQHKKYQSQPPFDKNLLKKLQSKKYQSKTFKELSGLIVSVHKQTKRVVKIELKWADNDTSIIGWQIQGSLKFPFDISTDERPICMFGSVYAINKGDYVLETLGCQINKVQ